MKKNIEPNIYHIYKSLENHIHEDYGHIKAVTPHTRRIVQANMAKFGLSPEQHMEIMLKIQDIHLKHKVKDKIKKEIEKHNPKEGK